MLSTLCQIKTNTQIYSSNHLLNEGGLKVNKYNNKKWLKSREYKPPFPRTEIAAQLQRLLSQLAQVSKSGGGL
ncbi:MAG TPA: hypothetical protein V6C90_17110 [Coleofasciculaceae cyanobacterium]